MKILDPTVDIPPITIDIDIDAHDSIVKHATKFFGQFVPLLTFGSNNIPWNYILRFELNVSMYNLPTISIVVDDVDYMIRSFLVDDMNIGLCRVGYEKYRMQFHVLYTDITSGKGNRVALNGVLWNDALWDTQGNVSYSNKNLIDTFKEICQFSKCGLVVYDNDYITQPIPLLINPGKSPLEFISDNIRRRTTNIWCWDPYYFLHVGDYDTIIDQPLSQYTLSLKTGEKLDEPHDMIFYQNSNFAKEEQPQDLDIEDDSHRYHIPVRDYSPDSVYFPNSKFSYAYATEKDIVEPPQADKGVGMSMTNIFSGFDSHPAPFMDAIRRKDIPQRQVKITTDFIIPEINPFSVVQLEFYKNTNFGNAKNMGNDVQLDELNSGKKVVSGYSIRYNKKKAGDQDEKLFEQDIYCI